MMILGASFLTAGALLAILGIRQMGTVRGTLLGIAGFLLCAISIPFFS